MLSQPPQPSGSQPLGHRDKQVNILCQSLVWKMPGLACLLGECYSGPVRSDLGVIRIQSPYLIPPLSIFHDIETSPHTSLPSHAMINVLSGMRPIIRIDNYNIPKLLHKDEFDKLGKYFINSDDLPYYWIRHEGLLRFRWRFSE